MKNGKYRETSKMSDLICENYPMVLVMSRFGIDLGFGEKNIGEVCRQNKIDTYTFPVSYTHLRAIYIPDCRQLSDGNGDNPGSGGP